MLEFKAAFRYIKKNKTQTLLAAVSVSLAVLLMTIISVAGTSLIASLRRSIIGESGNYHVKMINVSQSVYERISKDERVLNTCPITTEAGDNEQAYIYVPNNIGVFFVDDNYAPLKRDLVALELDGEVVFDRRDMASGDIAILYIQLINPSISYEIIKEFGEANTFPNNRLLDVYNIDSAKESTYKKTRTICLSIICIIVFASVLFISNAYMVSYNNEVKEAGLWMLLGATTLQLVKMIVYKALIISLVAVFVGESLGLLSIELLIRYGGEKLASLTYMTGDLDVFIEIRFMILIALLTILVGVAAALRPAHYITRMNGVSGRGSSSASITDHRIIRGTALNKNIFYKLIKRYNKAYFKKNVSAIITISVAVVTFLSITFLCNNEVAKLEKEWDAKGADIKINVAFDSYESFLGWYVKNLEKNNDIDSSYWYVNPGADIVELKWCDESGEELLAKDAPFSIIAVDDKMYGRILNKNSIDDIDCIVVSDNTGIGKISHNSSGLKDEEGYMMASIGDMPFNLRVETATFEDVNDFIECIDFGWVMIVPYDTITLFRFDEEETRYWEVFIKSKKHKAVSEYLRSTAGFDSISVNDIAENRQSEINQIITVRFFGYLIVGMISVVSLSNVILTVYHGIYVRKKDMVVLQTLGMRNDQLMIVFLGEAVSSVICISLIGMLVFFALYFTVFRNEYPASLGSVFKLALVANIAIAIAYIAAYSLAYLHIRRLNPADLIRY